MLVSLWKRLQGASDALIYCIVAGFFLTFSDWLYLYLVRYLLMIFWCREDIYGYDLC